MFAPRDTEDSATCLVLWRRALDPERQHFARCRVCSELMMTRVVTMTATQIFSPFSFCSQKIEAFSTIETDLGRRRVELRTWR
jgi:hypothetical protein